MALYANTAEEEPMIGWLLLIAVTFVITVLLHVEFFPAFMMGIAITNLIFGVDELLTAQRVNTVSGKGLFKVVLALVTVLALIIYYQGPIPQYP